MEALLRRERLCKRKRRPSPLLPRLHSLCPLAAAARRRPVLLLDHGLLHAGVGVLRARLSDLRAEILVGAADIGIGDLFLDHFGLAGLFKTERRCCSAKLLRQACGRIGLLLVRDLFGLGLQARLLCTGIGLGLSLCIGLVRALCIGLGGRIFGRLLRLGLFLSVALSSGLGNTARCTLCCQGCNPRCFLYIIHHTSHRMLYPKKA